MSFAILNLITGLLSFFSIINNNCKEIGVFTNENTNLGFYSNAFMRPIYGIAILIVKIIADYNNNKEISDLQNIFNIIFSIMPLIWMFGLLGNLFLTILYAMEKYN